jgi:hypothetical protein
MSAERCALCGNEADGFAMVGADRLCHGELRDCYHLCTVWAGVSHETLIRLLLAGRSL